VQITKGKGGAKEEGKLNRRSGHQITQAKKNLGLQNQNKKNTTHDNAGKEKKGGEQGHSCIFSTHYL